MDNSVDINMKDFWKSVGVQATSILLAALGAAAFSFFQSVAVSTGVCPSQVSNPTEVGLMGGIFKGIHSVLTMRHGIMHV